MKMIYHPDGKELIWGIMCKTMIIKESELKVYLSDGWFESPLDFTADKNQDGEIDIKEAKLYAKKHNINVKGLHWKQVVKAVEDHQNEQN